MEVALDKTLRREGDLGATVHTDRLSYYTPPSYLYTLYRSQTNCECAKHERNKYRKRWSKSGTFKPRGPKGARGAPNDGGVPSGMTTVVCVPLYLVGFR